MNSRLQPFQVNIYEKTWLTEHTNFTQFFCQLTNFFIDILISLSDIDYKRFFSVNFRCFLHVIFLLSQKVQF